MPMKPHKGESQDDFMARCMHETYGPDAPSDRTQEQAVAICFSYWREEHGGKAPAKTIEEMIARWTAGRRALDAADAPDPDDDESKDDFLDRCMDELTGNGNGDGDDGNGEVDEDAAQEICLGKWSDYQGARLKPGVTIFRSHSEPVIEGTNFVLSDESVDRMGEIITADGWSLDNFNKNPIALFNHRADFPIGRWSNLSNKDGKLIGKLDLAPAGTSPRIDEIRKLVEHGILRAVSVGFQAKKKEPMDDRADPYFGPFRYLKQELVECSLCSVPANANALAVAKNLKISPATIDVIFARPGNRDHVKRSGSNGRTARTTNGNGRRGTMSLAQRITDVQGQIVAKRDALTAHLEKMDDTNVSDTDLELTQTFNADITRLEKLRAGLIESEKSLAAGVDGNSGANGGRSKSLAVITANGGGGNFSGAAHTNGSPSVSTIGKKDLDLLDLIVRGGTVAYVSKMWGKDPNETRVKIYGDDEQTKVMTDFVLRAASAPAMTNVAGWAQELVQTTYAALMPLLMPNAIMTRLAAKGLTLSFGQTGRIIIPTRSRTPSLAGSFVGEGQAIPVRQGAFTSQTVTPKKMAVISTWTREMGDHSIPAIEGILREAIQTDTSVAVDSVLIDTNPATVIRPAGLLNGVAATTATAGGGLTALVGDIKALIGALTTSTYGNVRNPAFLMNPTDVLGAGLVSAPNTGIFPFKDEIKAGTLASVPIIDSATVPAKTMILVDAADFVVVGGEAPRFELSDQATLHMEDTAPLDLVSGSPGTVASPQRSLFQTDSIALRMVLPLNWIQRRAGTVAWTQNVTWS
jgi:HK97 family phage prohead protease